MENNKGQTIFLSVVGIATLLVAIVGATFAYFSISVQGNAQASSVTVTTAKVGGVEYRSTSDTINIVDAYPGWKTDKRFVIQSTDLGADQTVEYTIDIKVTTPDDATNLAHEAKKEAGKEEFYFTLDGSSTTGSAVDVARTAMPSVASTRLTNAIAATVNERPYTNGVLLGSETHSYVMHIEFEEQDTPQDHLQGKTYAAAIEVQVAEGAGARTYDEDNTNGQHWKTWTLD